MKTNLIILFALIALITSCKKEEAAPEGADLIHIREHDPSEDTIAKADTLHKTPEQQLKKEGYHNGICIQDITLKDSVATFTFTTDFDAFKKINPKSTATPKMLTSWWNNEVDFNRTFANNTARIFKENAFVNRVVIRVLYPEAIVHRTELSRKDWEAFYGLNTAEITADWKNFTRYRLDEKGRIAFFDKFKK